MQKISTSAGLKEAIMIMEADLDIKGEQLKNHLIITYVSLKPINVLRSTLRDISSPSLLEEISGTGIGLLGGFLSRKIFVGRSGNLIRKLIGSALQLGVTTVVASNSGIIQSAGMAIVQQLFQRHKMNPESRVI